MASTSTKQATADAPETSRSFAVAEPVDGASSEASSGRRRVLDAAAELFVAQGYAGTTLRQIAAQAGIKAGSIYHHFASKEELFVAVLADGMAVMIDAFDETAGTTASASAADRVRHHTVAHLRAVFENGPYTTAHVTSFFSAPAEVRSAVVPERDRYEQRWSDLLQKLCPEASSDQRRLQRLILFGAMNASAEWFDPSGGLSVNELAATISEQFLFGVTTGAVE